jgi:hypothetical protein
MLGEIAIDIEPNSRMVDLKTFRENGVKILTRPKNTRNKLLNVLYNAHGKNRCS